ncbi:MAG: DUF1361 domain-containing protein [Bacteroidota bacterium]
MLAIINQRLGTWQNLVPLSCFALGMLLFRIQFLEIDPRAELFHISIGQLFLFLGWNLFLAWVPLLLLALLRRFQPSRWAALPIIGLWFLFFPNAPYLITDLVHLRPRPGVPLWYDATMLFSYALLGLLIAVQALREMRTYLLTHVSRLWANGFIAFTILLSGLGVYLGRVERWNSWDVFYDPLGPVYDTLRIISTPAAHAQAWLMMMVVTGLVGSCYWWGRRV